MKEKGRSLEGATTIARRENIGSSIEKKESCVEGERQKEEKEEEQGNDGVRGKKSSETMRFYNRITIIITLN